MFSEAEADETIYRLQHEKNVWRGIAIGLGVALMMLVAIGVVGGVFLAKRSQLQALREEAVMQEALQEAERQAAEDDDSRFDFLSRRIRR
jgi:hypothetical protein